MREVEFIGTIQRQIYSTDNYKMYAVEVDRDKYPDIKFTIYGSATICGNLHSLTPNSEYLIKATEKNGTKGYLYQVINIKKTELNSVEDAYGFLQEVLTFSQASELYREYPNIIQLVVSGEADSKVDLTRLYGIGEYTFNCIKNKIIENYALYDLINEFQGALTISMLKKLYEAYPSIEKIRSELRNRPYSCLCNLSRVGFKTADEILLKLEKDNIIKFNFDLRTSKERCLACIIFFLEDNESNGNTRMSLVDLRKQVMHLVPKCAEHFADCLKDNLDLIYYDTTTLDISLKSTYDTELEISNIIHSALKIDNPWIIDWSAYQNEGEYPLTDEQLNGLKNVCDNQISILCGNAGAGKTATTNTLIKMLIDNNKSFRLVASTGRASKILSGYTNMPAQTIHRAYGYNPSQGWNINKDNKIDTDTVICDEFSMVDVFLFLRLLEGIDFNRTKLLIIGDDAQACSVACGNCLNDLINSETIPTTQLSKIFRYGSGGLMTVATDVRNGKQFLKASDSGLKFFGQNKDYAFLSCADEKIVDNCVALYRKLLDKGNKPEDILVLSAQNKGSYGTAIINQALQKVVNPNYGSPKFMKVGSMIYYEGDMILQCVNNYHAKLYMEEMNFGEEKESLETLVANGEIGRIKKIEHGLMIIDIDGVLIQYDQADLQNISLAYSCSIHKSQGGGAKIVIVLTPKAHTFMNNSNLLYVGLTRTKEQCYHLGDPTTVNRSVKKKENLMRNTFLCKMLKERSKE